MIGVFIILGVLLGIASAKKPWRELAIHAIVICILLLSLHMLLHT
jgi:hypothetical protein